MFGSAPIYDVLTSCMRSSYIHLCKTEISRTGENCRKPCRVYARIKYLLRHQQKKEKLKSMELELVHKVFCNEPKNLDTRKKCCNYPKILTLWLYQRVTCPKDGKANSADPDKTPPSLFWVYSVCPDLSAQKLRHFLVSKKKRTSAKDLAGVTTSFSVSNRFYGSFSESVYQQ